MSMFGTPQVILFSEDVSRAAEFYAGLGFTESFRVRDRVALGFTLGAGPHGRCAQPCW
ncbi:hypothetical protein AB0C19_15720 [Micromonospora sp. NPDC048842]|uniref:hypothetical protein n=1 Tax=Micromonospora sp. NPDC048842 TaxID=3154346 RepID=UPI0033C3D09E